MNRSLVTVALALSCTAALSAESQPAIPKGMAACAEVADVAQRASCYDSEVAKLRGQGKSAPASTPPPLPAVSTPAATADFGAESLSSNSHAAAQAPILEAKVAAVRELQPGVYLLTLDNGQIWSQPERRSGFELKTGDVIKIRKATMGAYRLWLESKGPKQWVRVVRLQ